MKLTKKAAFPFLPGKLGKMTLAELDAESDQYDAPFSAIDLPYKKNARLLPRRGRPRKSEADKSRRVLVTFDPALLAQADAAAEASKLTRAGLIHEAVKLWLAKASKRKSA